MTIEKASARVRLVRAGVRGHQALIRRLAPSGTPREGEEERACDRRPQQQHRVRESVEIEEMTVRPVEETDRRARVDQVGREQRGEERRQERDRRERHLHRARQPDRHREQQRARGDSQRHPGREPVLPRGRLQQDRRGNAFHERRGADQQQHRAADIAPLAQEQREKEADSQQLERAVRASTSVAATSGAAAASPGSGDGSYIVAKSGMPGFTCTTSQIAISAMPMSPTGPDRNQRLRAPRWRASRSASARTRRRARRPTAAPAVSERRSAMLASRMGRNVCSVSIDSERSAPAATAIASRAAGGQLRGISATKNPNGRYATRLVSEVVTHPARRPRCEQEERRPRRRRHPVRERLQARVDDRQAIERREEMREARMGRGAATLTASARLARRSARRPRIRFVSDRP